MDNFIGRASLQAGLKMYVDKFAYKNTELSDLVKCLNTALHEHGEADIDLVAWTDDWLKTAGPNTLQAQLGQKEDGTLSIDIIQGFSKYGDEIYRE